MFKCILVAVDGSHTAELALQEAIKLAKELQAQRRIVHAIDVTNINLGTEFPNSSEISDVMTKSGQEILRKAGAVPIDTLGHRIPEVIAADAEAWSADLDSDLHAWPQRAESPASWQRCRRGGSCRHETGAADSRKMSAIHPVRRKHRHVSRRVDQVGTLQNQHQKTSCHA